MDSAHKTALRKEEKEWLVKRNKYFKKLESNLAKSTNENSSSQDAEMLMYDDKAKFMKERVLELIKRLTLP